MKIVMDMGPNYRQAAAERDGMGRALISACSAGLETGVQYAAGIVKRDHLSGQDLKARTRNLARSVDGWLEGDLHGVVGVPKGTPVEKYKWLLGDEQKTITPKRARYLTIPIGEGLTPSGVARYKSIRQAGREKKGFFVRTDGRLLFGYKRGQKGKFRPLFTLVKSVFVQGSGALYDGVMESLDHITRAMETEIERQLGTN